MPFSAFKDKLPDAVKDKSLELRQLFVRTANAVLEKTGNETKAIQAGIHAVVTEEHKKKKLAKAALDRCKAIVNKITEDKTKVNTEDDIPGVPLQVVKSVDAPLKQVTYVAMQEGTDLHGDYVSSEDVRVAKESFNRQLRKARMSNLFHLVETDSFDIIESFLLPCDASLNGYFVKKGTWLVTLQILDDDLFNMIMNDEITGVSIGALAKTLQVED